MSDLGRMEKAVVTYHRSMNNRLFRQRYCSYTKPSSEREKRPRHVKPKTGDFVTDNYSQRQQRIIRLEPVNSYPPLSKRDIRYLLDKCEKLGDFTSLEIIKANYPDLVEAAENPEGLQTISDEDFDKLINEKAGF